MNIAPLSHTPIEKSKPELVLIKNDNLAKITIYKLARVIYAETRGISLRSVEALASTISNLHFKTGRALSDIATDVDIFESLNRESPRHQDLFIDSATRKFQMCLRTVKRMIGEQLKDPVMGATRFHRIENVPVWSIATGYVAEIDELLFYL